MGPAAAVTSTAPATPANSCCCCNSGSSCSSCTNFCTGFCSYFCTGTASSTTCAPTLLQFTGLVVCRVWFFQALIVRRIICRTESSGRHLLPLLQLLKLLQLSAPGLTTALASALCIGFCSFSFSFISASLALHGSNKCHINVVIKTNCRGLSEWQFLVWVKFLATHAPLPPSRCGFNVWAFPGLTSTSSTAIRSHLGW
jgi:hypothetical protein